MKVSMTSGIAFITIGSHDETARVTSREFKFRGKTVTMTLTAPYVRNDGLHFDIGAAWVFDGIYNPKTMTEPQLGEQVSLPMGTKSRFEMLLGLKEHEMHHRAQLFLIERMVGIVPHLTRAREAAQAARS